MKKILILGAIAILTASCATGGDKAVQKSLTNINEELVVIQKSITDTQTSIEDLQSGAAKAGADISANTDAIAELRSELAYANNEIMVMKGGKSKNALPPVEDTQTLDGLSPVIEVNVPKNKKKNNQQIIIIDDSNSSKKELYSQGLDLINKGKYIQARGKFQDFLVKYTKDNLSGNAQYWIGETYYSTNDMRNALQSFQKVVANYPKSVKVADAMLKIGYVYEKTGDRTSAVNTLKSLINKYPKSNAAKLAADKLQTWGA